MNIYMYIHIHMWVSRRGKDAPPTRGARRGNSCHIMYMCWHVYYYNSSNYNSNNNSNNNSSHTDNNNNSSSNNNDNNCSLAKG